MHVFSVKQPPTSLQQVIIEVILKENKEPNHPVSYRPISIQNTHCEMLANSQLESVTL